MEDCASRRGLASWSLPLKEAATASAFRVQWPAAPRTTAPEAGQQAELERQLGDVERRLAGLEAEDDERVQLVSGRLEALERIVSKLDGDGLLPRLSRLERMCGDPRWSRLERMCEEARQDAERSWCKLELRLGASLAGLKDPQAERERWEHWERRTCGLEQRIAELEGSAGVACAACGASEEEPQEHDEGQASKDRPAREKHDDVRLERRITQLEGQVLLHSMEEESERPKGPHVSINWMLDLDKQLFDLCQQVDKLDEKLLGVDVRQSVADKHDSNVESFQVDLGKAGSKIETIEACCQNLSHRVVDLERLWQYVGWKQDAAPASVDADFRYGFHLVPHFSL